VPPARPFTLPLLSLLAACASGPTPLYQGAERPREQVALIERVPVSKARLYAIDRSRAHGDAFLVMPGPHTVWINFQVIRMAGDTTYTIWAYCQMEFEAMAGATYRVESFATQERQKGADVKTQMGARITDAKGAMVAYASQCTGKPPRFD
jgi:hypothetical protein